MNALLDKLKKNTTIKETNVLSESKLFSTKDLIQTAVPALNVALSGKLDGGLTPGLTIFAGPSKHFKTAFAMMLVKSFLDKYDDGIVLFYDSEFGAPQSYFENFGIDTGKVVHTPITDIEQLKHDIMKQVNELERKDRVMIVVDSVGNLASKKELEDALNEKSVADMSRAKAIKGLFRMVTPYLTMKDVPLLAINHTYQEMGLFPKAIVSGGSGIYYSANDIWIIGRRQNKTGTEVTGYDFVVNIEKSRSVKEKSKIPITVSWDGGVRKYSGLLDCALAGNYVTKPSNGWYAAVDQSTGEIGHKVRHADTLDESFWSPIFANTDFKDFLKKQYSIGHQSLVDMDKIVEEA